MQVNPGELRHKIAIYREGGEPNERGFCEERTFVMCRWAKFTRRTGREKLSAGQEIQEAYCRFLIRYTKVEITHEMVIIYNGKVYDIEDVNDIGQRKEYIEIYCRERDA